MENKLLAPIGANKNPYRKGRGKASGNGRTGGRGFRGQNSRSGGGVRLGFEGGQTPLFRRLPRRGFNNSKYSTPIIEVTLELLERLFDNGSIINAETLVERNLIKEHKSIKNSEIKVIGNQELTKKFTVNVDRVSKNAQAMIEKAGGSVTLTN